MAKRKFNINLFDLLVLLAIICVGLICVFSYNNKPFLGEKNVVVEVIVSDPTTIQAVLPSLRLADVVYFSGTKYPVRQLSYRTENDANGQIKQLYITLVGPGTIDDGRSIFNGQRIFTNQKVEIRADYYAKGYVTGFRYAN